MTYAVIGFLSLALLVVYSALVVGARADRQTEAWARNRGVMR